MTDERKNEIWQSLPGDLKIEIRGFFFRNTKMKSPQKSTQVLIALFGYNNLTKQADEKPKEPRFRVGDKVKVMASAKPYQYGSIHTITELHADQEQCEYLLDKSNTVWCDESSLEPYTEPKEEQNHENISSNSQNCEKFTENCVSNKNMTDLTAPKVDYAQYRLDLAKEIAAAGINHQNPPRDLNNFAKGVVIIANEIIKRLKETEE